MFGCISHTKNLPYLKTQLSLSPFVCPQECHWSFCLDVPQMTDMGNTRNKIQKTPKAMPRLSRWGAFPSSGQNRSYCGGEGSELRHQLGKGGWPGERPLVWVGGQGKTWDKNWNSWVRRNSLSLDWHAGHVKSSAKLCIQGFFFSPLMKQLVRFRA